MSTEDNKHPSDEQLSELYRSLSHQQPPQALDDVILAAARQQIAEHHQPEKSVLRRWYVPVSAVAVVMISFSVVIKLVVDEQALSPDMSVMPRSLPEAEMAADQDQSTPPESARSMQRKERSAEMDTMTMESQAVGSSFNAQPSSGQHLLESVPAPVPELKKSAVAKQKAMPARQLLRSDSNQVMDAEGDAISADEQEVIQHRLDKMQLLLDAQKFDDLQVALKAFRQQYADYPLPPALANWYARNPPAESD